MVWQIEVRAHWNFWRCTACGDRTDPVIERNRAFYRTFFCRPDPKLVAEMLFRDLVMDASRARAARP